MAKEAHVFLIQSTLTSHTRILTSHIRILTSHIRILTSHTRILTQANADSKAVSLTITPDGDVRGVLGGDAAVEAAKGGSISSTAAALPPRRLQQPQYSAKWALQVRVCVAHACCVCVHVCVCACVHEQMYVCVLVYLASRSLQSLQGF